MRKINYLLGVLSAFVLFNVQAQVDVQKLIAYPFDADSLYGFNEEFAIQEGLANNCTSTELKYFLYKKKREFIIQKYNLQKYEPTDYLGWITKNTTPPSIQTTACNNEDFELGNFTGWTVNQGSNSNSCSMAGCCGGGPGLASILTTPAANPYGGSPLTNIPNSPLGGTKVAVLNNNTAGAKAVRISKTFAVTPSNSLFQFAFMAVLQNPGHSCCDQPYVKITFSVSSNCTGPPTPTTCPTFSIVPPSTGCSATFSGWVNSGGLSYTPNWIVSSADLTPFIGSCITIDITVGDCTLSGHYGYAFFDALCSPMDITTDNGATVNTYPAGSPTITASMCGYTSATLTAPPGLGPYTWQGPAGFPTQTTQAVVTNLIGNYTLTMNPPGACSPITRTITVINSPAPALQVTPIQPSCTNSLSACTATASLGSGSFSINWTPAPTSTAQTSANTFSASGLAAGNYTVTVRDSVGCTATQIFSINPAPVIPTFSISLSDDTLTCYQPTVSATAVSTNTNASPSYTFTSISSGTFAGNPYTVSSSGTYTVFAQDANSGCITTNTFAVGVYTSVPSVTVTPNSINIPCNGTAGTFTGSSTPTANVIYSWLQPGGGVLSGNLLTPGFAGTYTFVATNIANGCSNTYTVAATQSTAAPTMTLTATNNNFNIKCNPNTVTLTINATQAAGGGAPQVYWSNGTSTLSTNNTFTFNTPGNYIGCAYDPAPGGCTICQTVTIGMDTLRPAGGYTLNVPTNTLTCTYSTAVITGTSPVSGVTYIWYTPGTVPQQTLSVNSTTNISQTTIGTYTVEITNPSNGCKTKIPVTMFQNKQPLGLTAKATPTALTCKDLQATLQFTPNPIGDPLTFTWTTPAPTETNNLNNPVTYYSAGTYTICVTRNSNGCTTCTNVLVGSNTTPPATTAVGPYTIQCGSTVTTIQAGTTPSTNITYVWDGPPGSTITPITGYSPTVTHSGQYIVVITNTTTGCASQNYVTVVNGTVNADFTPNPSEGFAPLDVAFTNNSSFGNPSNLTYYWSFGNGGTVITTANPSVTLPGTSTTYNAPGTYTVTMIIKNGNCVDTAYKVIKVDIPSDLEVPNIFTPNGDGVNDYFILHTANLTDINCIIFDRWGAEMYNVSTDKGNIQWDGKTKGGKDAPAGTYFYTIKATGKDGKEYKKEGYITLVR
ncbi:MAG TPA: gliding motility-associated C-terminal domain-containing protein [Bacteroidia bacterium]|nr:gliding motility-associated C-terminal domain-containing protein [Bacteroidia bacterium]